MDQKVQRGKLAERKKETFLQRFKIEKKKRKEICPEERKSDIEEEAYGRFGRRRRKGEGGGISRWWRVPWEREEAGGHRVSLSRMRSDLSPSFSLPRGPARARCWYSKTLSGDERHYPHHRGW